MQDSGKPYDVVTNNFPLQPKALNIFLTERCVAECAMCAVCSSPRITNSDTSEHDAMNWVIQASHIESIVAICLVGGEPFLRLPTIDVLSRKCNELGLALSVVTNCYWAKDGKHASSRIKHKRHTVTHRVIGDNTDEENDPSCKLHLPISPTSAIVLPLSKG